MTGPIPVDVLAYAAGIIDADGTIGIVRDTWAMRHGVVCQATFTERIDVRQLEPEAVAMLHQTSEATAESPAGRIVNSRSSAGRSETAAPPRA